VCLCTTRGNSKSCNNLIKYKHHVVLLCGFPQRTQKFAAYGDHAETGTGWFEDDCRDVTVFRQHMAHGVNIAGR
jgi:hypothetical protein